MAATATAVRAPRRFGSVRPRPKDRGHPWSKKWQARYMVDGEAVTRHWRTEAEARAWLAWVEPRATRRWPPEPLKAMPGFVSTELLAEHLGISRAAVSKALGRGLTAGQADRFAYALGYHPWEVWGVAWLEAAAEEYPGPAKRARRRTRRGAA